MLYTSTCIIKYVSTILFVDLVVKSLKIAVYQTIQWPKEKKSTNDLLNTTQKTTFLIQDWGCRGRDRMVVQDFTGLDYEQRNGH
jgi:hypothetical protein